MSLPSLLITQATMQISSLADQMATAATSKQINTLIQLEAQMLDQEHIIKDQVKQLEQASKPALDYIAKMQEYISACTSLEPKKFKAKRPPLNAAQKKLTATLKNL